MKDFQPDHIAAALAMLQRAIVAAYRIPDEVTTAFSLIPLDGDLCLMLLAGSHAIKIPLQGDGGSGSLFVVFMNSALAEHTAIKAVAARLRKDGESAPPVEIVDIPHLTLVGDQ